jgi:hypothetical protein
VKKSFLTLLLISLTAPMVVAHASWFDKTTLKGDFRYRIESIDQEEADVRERMRLRARLELNASPTDELTLSMRIASGGTDPGSTNQTLDGGFTSKSIVLDRAYFKWHPNMDSPFYMMAGKVKNPFYTMKGLVWDSDVTPEGLTFHHALAGIQLTAAYFATEERKADDDSNLIALEAINSSKLGSTKLTYGASYFMWGNMKGFTPLVNEEDSFGNSLNPDGTYTEDFSVVQAFMKASFNFDLPVSIYMNMVTNTEAEENNAGFLIGATIGKAKKTGSFQIDVNFRELESDATVGALSDSDVWGGGTNGKGLIISTKYQAAKNLQIAATHMLNEAGLEESTDYSRTQLDLIAKF